MPIVQRTALSAAFTRHLHPVYPVCTIPRTPSRFPMVRSIMSSQQALNGSPTVDQGRQEEQAASTEAPQPSGLTMQIIVRRDLLVSFSSSVLCNQSLFPRTDVSFVPLLMCSHFLSHISGPTLGQGMASRTTDGSSSSRSYGRPDRVPWS